MACHVLARMTVATRATSALKHVNRSTRSTCVSVRAVPEVFLESEGMDPEISLYQKHQASVARISSPEQVGKQGFRNSPYKRCVVAVTSSDHRMVETFRRIRCNAFILKLTVVFAIALIFDVLQRAVF